MLKKRNVWTDLKSFYFKFEVKLKASINFISSVTASKSILFAKNLIVNKGFEESKT